MCPISFKTNLDKIYQKNSPKKVWWKYRDHKIFQKYHIVGSYLNTYKVEKSWITIAKVLKKKNLHIEIKGFTWWPSFTLDTGCYITQSDDIPVVTCSLEVTQIYKFPVSSADHSKPGPFVYVNVPKLLRLLHLDSLELFEN